MGTVMNNDKKQTVDQWMGEEYAICLMMAQMNCTRTEAIELIEEHADQNLQSHKYRWVN